MHRALNRCCDQAMRFALVVLIVFAAAIAGADELLIEHATLIDGTGRAPASDMSVLIKGERIVRVHRGPLDAPKGTTRIDAAGKFLIPGLMDTHIHLAGGRRGAFGTKLELVVDKETGRRALHGYLYSGVTSVYDSGNYDNFILEVRDDERSGRMLSPRIFATGRLVTSIGGYADGAGGIAIDTYEEGAKALDALFKKQPDLVKFTRQPHNRLTGRSLPILPLDVLERLISYCNENGFRTTVHATNQTSAQESISAGIDAMAHPIYSERMDASYATRVATKKIPVSTSMTVIRNIARIADDPGFFDEPLFQAILSEGDIQHNQINERKRYRESGCPIGPGASGL